MRDWAISAGGAGTGEERRTMSSAALSRTGLPEERAMREEVTRPFASTVKATCTVPSWRFDFAAEG